MVEWNKFSRDIFVGIIIFISNNYNKKKNFKKYAFFLKIFPTNDLKNGKITTRVF